MIFDEVLQIYFYGEGLPPSVRVGGSGMLGGGAKQSLLVDLKAELGVYGTLPTDNGRVLYLIFRN